MPQLWIAESLALLGADNVSQRVCRFDRTIDKELPKDFSP